MRGGQALNTLVSIEGQGIAGCGQDIGTGHLNCCTAVGVNAHGCSGGGGGGGGRGGAT